jgi:hypothetical protein
MNTGQNRMKTCEKHINAAQNDMNTGQKHINTGQNIRTLVKLIQMLVKT